MPQQPGRGFIWIAIAIIGFAALSAFIGPRQQVPEVIAISEVATLVQEGQVKEVVVTNDTELAITKQDDTKLRSTLRTGDDLKDFGITPDKTSIKVEYSTSSAAWASILGNLLVPIIILAVIFAMFRSSQNQNQRAMGFGQARAKLANFSKIRFADVAGQREAKQELMEEVDFLRDPAKFRALGAEIPKGVLLVGPPGTGKTLLAKAVAGEAGVPFFTISASEFVEMFVGVGASRVRDLFAKAKKASPCIIFIDELDAIGRQRGAGLGGGHDEREQTLNQILVEMDGFETDGGVIVMAATNRPDVLDPALLRPGRFDRRVVVDLPTRDERIEVLQVYTKGKPLAKDVDLAGVANQTAGMSPADLKNIMNEAAIFAARKGEKQITQATLHEAAEKVLVGPERPSRVLSDQEKKVTAVHEAGHAIVGHVLPHTDDVHKVSIISRGNALGLTWSLPKEDRHLIGKAKFEDELCMLLGGRLAEMAVFDEATTGASNDLERVTKLARRMVTEYGMSDTLGLRTYGEREHEIFLGRSMGESRDYSEDRAQVIDSEVDQIVKRAETRTKELLTMYRPALDKLTDLLLERETVTGEELTRILEETTGIIKEPVTV